MSFSVCVRRCVSCRVVSLIVSCVIKQRVGRCDAYATEVDLEADEYVPLPKGTPPRHTLLQRERNVIFTFIFISLFISISIYYLFVIYINMC